MKRVFGLAIFLAATSLICAQLSLAQQTKDPVTTVLRDALAGRQKNTVAAFEAMPADKYDYKPTPDQMTFGHLAAHIVEANDFFCSNAGNIPAPKHDDFKGTEGKDKLVAAVKSSFEFCGTALDKASDSTLGDSIKGFDGKPKLRSWAFMGLASSWADHYGTAAMYLRLNNILPPTAQPKK